MTSALAGRRVLFEALEPRLLLSGSVELLSAATAVFVENAGQWDASVRYACLGDGGNVLHTTDGPVVQLFGAEGEGGAAVSVQFDGAAAVNPAGRDPSGGHYNFHLGDQADWRSGVGGYETVAYDGLYDGVDLLTWGRSDGLKYEFHVAPGADPDSIQMTYAGADALYLKKGELRVVTPLGELVDDKPVAWQVKPNGKRRNLKAKYELLDADTVAFTLRRNALPDAEMIIDPNIAWGTYLGGTAEESALDVAVDPSDNVLAAGRTESANWVMGGQDTTFNGNDDAYVVKLDTNGGHLWSTYVGGSGVDGATGVATDTSGNVFLCGSTQSDGWVAGGWDTARGGGSDAFVAKLSPTGAYGWATYLGGASFDQAHDIAVDGSQHPIVVGGTRSSGWTAGGWDTSYNGGTWGDGFVAEFTNAGTHLWSTYLGDSGTDEAFAVTTDSSSNVLVAGETFPGAAPWVAGGYDTTPNGLGEAFIAKLSTTGDHTWSTYVGGDSFDYARGVATDGSNVYATGFTHSAGWVAGGYDLTYGGSRDGYAVKVTNTGAHAWSTYLGGDNDDWGLGVTVSSTTTVYVAGTTESDGWCTGGFQLKSNVKKAEDGFVASLAAADGAHNWSSYLGGKGEEWGQEVTTDSTGAILVCGSTESKKWKPALAGGWDSTYAGDQDAFVVKINNQDGRDIAGSFDEAKSKFPATVTAGDPKLGVIKKVIALARNEGNLPIPAGLFTCSLYASVDQDLPGSSLLATARVKRKLTKPGKPQKVQFKKVPVAALPGGPYYLLVEFDALDEVAEFNENNNTAVTANTVQWT